ncbi:TIGR04104 family putative zinc finger protein [Paenisporosarcina sp. TG20]|uniref:TIGR04104 family putative zinc finger protein n=1 Tax=Paenisporosarcina sp. TG20 TaxID=1211706 RepID=UPI0002E174C5|nr:TIGR04104 family putative zinc finger protein [Paenisporosarcina sp. TG20]
MTTCVNCNNKWSWKQTIKKTTTLNPSMTCPFCEEEQYQTQKSKMKIGFLTPIVLLPLLIQIFFDIPDAILLSLFPVLVVIVLLSYPFLVELSNREEYTNFFRDKR